MKDCEKSRTFLFSLLKVTGLQLFLLPGCWEIHLLPFGTTFILITISVIKGSHWALALGLDPVNKEGLGLILLDWLFFLGGGEFC